MFSTKAQSLSINTLILVALGILILIVGILMYNKYVDRADSTLSNCENQGGTCTVGACPEGTLKNFIATCQNDEICCLGDVKP